MKWIAILLALLMASPVQASVTVGEVKESYKANPEGAWQLYSPYLAGVRDGWHLQKNNSHNQQRERRRGHAGKGRKTPPDMRQEIRGEHPVHDTRCTVGI